LDKAAVIVAWGNRETAYQRARIFPAEDAEAAGELAARIIEQKIRRGYVAAGG
jgi:predicted DNA-binding WGR domain protein